MQIPVKQILVKVSQALDKAKIPYMVIGGQAVLLYGTPRLTRDIDIILGVNTGRLAEISAIARKLHLRIVPADYREFTTRTMVLPLADKKSGFGIDFIFSFTPYETQAIKRAKPVRFGRAVVRFASPEDVIIHKVFAGRPRDLEDAESIILKNPRLDKRYIQKWLGELEGSSDTHKKLSAGFKALLKRTKR